MNYINIITGEQVRVTADIIIGDVCYVYYLRTTPQIYYINDGGKFVKKKKYLFRIPLHVFTKLFKEVNIPLTDSYSDTCQ